MTQDEREHRIVSRADIVFDTLENDIISGKLAPGSILSEQKISEQLGVSRTPVREALNRLKQAELLQERKKGLTVVGISKQDIEDIYEIRLHIEGLATARCAQIITDQQLQRLKEIINMEMFYTERGTSDEIKDVDGRFHEFIYEHCGSNIFCTTLLGLHKKIMKYRKLSVQNPVRARVALKEHQTIYDALCAHDTDAAKTAALTHVQNAKQHVLQAKDEEER